MTHRAELIEVIRALEAELARRLRPGTMWELSKQVDDATARAEKAEAEVEQLMAAQERVYRKYVDWDDDGLSDMFEHLVEGHSRFFKSCAFCRDAGLDEHKRPCPAAHSPEPSRTCTCRNEPAEEAIE